MSTGASHTLIPGELRSMDHTTEVVLARDCGVGFLYFHVSSHWLWISPVEKAVKPLDDVPYIQSKKTV